MCPPSAYSPSPWDVWQPSSPVSSCDPATYPSAVVLALVELRDTVALGSGLLSMLLAAQLTATIVLLRRA